ncbi:MAG: DUF5119 domain-containing protein [Rikenellaceae bacterium]
MRKIVFLAAAMLLSLSCTRRDLSEGDCTQSGAESALIEVSVDWSLSGFDTEQISKGVEDYIHRVSFRFFPLDGSAPFDRYLEDDVESGVLDIPVGEYSVVIFNESIYDPYWQNSILFEDVDSYDLFAAKIVDQDPELYDFYTPAEQEALSVEALQLASCSIDYFVVSDAMASLSSQSWDQGDLEMAELLNPATPRRLTCPTVIEVEVENLSSAYSVSASLTGLAQRVFMASGDTDTLTTTHVGDLTQRLWDDGSLQHGTIYESRLTFSTPAATSTHTLTLDVILIDGTRHTPEEEMVYDVSDQILSAATRYADNDLGASVSLSLPEVSGDVEVDAWGDENQITIL